MWNKKASIVIVFLFCISSIGYSINTEFKTYGISSVEIESSDKVENYTPTPTVNHEKCENEWFFDDNKSCEWAFQKLKNYYLIKSKGYLKSTEEIVRTTIEQPNELGEIINHHGRNWAPNDQQTVSGIHINIKNFVIPASQAINLENTKIFQVYAKRIICNGTLNGTGHGYSKLSGPGVGSSGTGGGNNFHGKASGGGGGGAGSYGGNGGHGGDGGSGGGYSGGNGGSGGSIYGNAQTYDIQMGSGGGAGGEGGCDGCDGGSGGGAIVLMAEYIENNGEILANGGIGDSRNNNGGNPDHQYGGPGGGGGGSGGGILINTPVLINNGIISANGGQGGPGGIAWQAENGFPGDMGGGGRIKIFYHDLFTPIENHFFVDGNSQGSIYFEKWNNPPNSPLVIIPLNNSYSQPQSSLDWNCTDPENDPMKYQVQLINDGGSWNSPMIDQTTDLNVSSYQITNPLTDGWTYHWRVRANDTFEWGPWSDVFTFTVDADEPTVQNPIYGLQYTNSNYINWTWPASNDTGSGIIGYYVNVEDDTRNAFIDNAFTSNSWYNATNLQDDRTYYCQIRCVNGAGAISDLSPRSSGVLVDLNIPITNIPKSPGKYNNNGTVKWTWDPPSNTGSGISGYYVKITDNLDNIIADEEWTNTNYFEQYGLMEDRTYYCQIKAQNRAGTIGEFSDKSEGIKIDLTPPEIILTNPINGSTGISNTTWLTIQFSENISQDYLSANCIKLNNPTQNTIPCTIEISGPIIIIKPEILLEDYTEYSVILSDEIFDLAENNLLSSYSFNFTTGGIITIPEMDIPKGVLYIKNIIPSNNSVEVPINSTISIEFSSTLNLSTLNNSIILKGPNGTVSGKLEYDNKTNTLKFIPDIHLENGSTYTLEILPIIKNMTDSPLDEYHRYRFTTIMPAQDTIQKENDTDKKEIIENVIVKEDDDLSIWLFISIGLLLVVILLIVLLIRRKKGSKNNLERESQTEVETDGVSTSEDEFVDDDQSEFSNNETFTEPPPEQFSQDQYHYEAQSEIQSIENIRQLEIQNPQAVLPVPTVNNLLPPSDPKQIIIENTSSCPVCFGNIKVGNIGYECSCGKIYHIDCVQRVGECPDCGRKAIISKDGFKSEKPVPEPQIPALPEPKIEVIQPPEPTPTPEDQSKNIVISEGAVKCRICFGVIKSGLPVYVCDCGKKYHPECSKRVGECPSCEKTINISDGDLVLKIGSGNKGLNNRYNPPVKLPEKDNMIDEGLKQLPEMATPPPPPE